jgi:coenzyme F420-reducing hydrogenase beta subunit
MEKVIEQSKCCGCTACMSICPKKAIKMIELDNGFKYPTIDKEKCIDCGMCKKTCPILNSKNNSSINECYAGYATDDKIKKKTSSGGIFPLIADYIFSKNGIVIGAAFDENKKLIHKATKNKDELEALMGSKYVQSDMCNIFDYIKENIKYNLILFVGTPCQVAGLKKFIKKDYNNLICIDLICHGVPSPKLFKKYINELETENGKIINYSFRDKKNGWKKYYNRVTFENKEIIIKAYKNPYMRLFLSDIALRKSCYKCSFKLGNKYSDITLGDFWGIKNYYPEMYDKNGVSAIIINTKKGKEIYNLINDKIKYKKCTIEEILNGNSSLVKSPNEPKKREEFFKEIDELNIEKLEKKYCKKTTIIKKVLIKLKIIRYG